MKTIVRTAFIVLSVVALLPLTARADRLRDIVEVVGARSNQLVGYGIVVGLGGTGDGTKASINSSP